MNPDQKKLLKQNKTELLKLLNGNFIDGERLTYMKQLEYPDGKNFLHILYKYLDGGNQDRYLQIFSSLTGEEYKQFLQKDAKGNTPLHAFAKRYDRHGTIKKYKELRDHCSRKLLCNVGGIRNIQGKSPDELVGITEDKGPAVVSAELVYEKLDAVSPGVEESPRAEESTGAAESPRVVGLTGAAGSPRAAESTIWSRLIGGGSGMRR